MKDKRLYWVWAEMLSRCRNQRHRQYADYGGRGVTVCERWRVFANFSSDMGPRPDGMTLDRRDNSGPYSPDNCRWASRQEQNSNRRNCIYVDYNGQRLTLKEASVRAGLRYRQVHKRVTQYRWPVAKALTTPIREGRYGTR